jgi:hypothetical protein
VGGRHITAAALASWTSAGSGLPPARLHSLERQALGVLIVAYWAIGGAERLGMDPSEREVAQQVARIGGGSVAGGAGEPAEQVRAMAQAKGDASILARAELALAGLRRAALGHQPPVTPGEVAAYYARHRQELAIPERREVMITNRKSAAEVDALRGEIARGKSFTAASQPIAIERLRGVRPNVLERAIYASAPRVLTGPVKQRVDYYLFEVLRVRQASTRPLAQVSATIERRLAREAGQRALAAFAGRWSREWTARTDCSPGYVVAQCRQYRGPRPGAASLSLP